MAFADHQSSLVTALSALEPLQPLIRRESGGGGPWSEEAAGAPATVASDGGKDGRWSASQNFTDPQQEERKARGSPTGLEAGGP